MLIQIFCFLPTAWLALGVCVAPLCLFGCGMKFAAEQSDQQSSQPRKADRYRQETKALYKKYGASPLMSVALPIIQLPLYVGFFLGLRRMADAVPDFATGGTMWFQVTPEKVESCR